MKKTMFLLTGLLFLNCFWALGQEFSFQMYFEDAEGNRDTLTIGYDLQGSRDTINPEFGEENIADTPFDSIFDVRITNQADINGAGWNYDYELYHTKKKIVLLPCNEDYFWFQIMPFVNIDIRAKYWPVTIEWNKSLFKNECHEISLFTPLYPGFWWDTGYYFSDFMRITLENNSELTFSANFPENWEDHPVDYDFFNYYVDAEGNPIATYWLAFGDSTLLILNTPDVINSSETKVYPNPTQGKINFRGHETGKIKKLTAFNTSGQKFRIPFSENTADMSSLKNGIYFLKFTMDDGNHFTEKIVIKK